MTLTIHNDIITYNDGKIEITDSINIVKDVDSYQACYYSSAYSPSLKTFYYTTYSNKIKMITLETLKLVFDFDKNKFKNYPLDMILLFFYLDNTSTEQMKNILKYI